MRRASLDIGSNSVRLMVVEWTDEGVKPVRDWGVLTRIGDSIARTGALHDRPLEDTLSVVRSACDEARAMGAPPTCFATAGLRDASNRETVLQQIESAAGTRVHLVSGEEEALLSFYGVRATAPPSGDVVIVDVGGGSTEIAWGGDEPEGFVSIPIGARKLLAEAPNLAAEGAIPQTAVDNARTMVQQLLAGTPNLPRAGDTLVAVGGTATTLTALSLGLPAYMPMVVQGALVRLEAVESLLARLCGTTHHERGQTIGEPLRADLIVPGLIVVTSAMERLGASQFHANIYGPRVGVLTDAGQALLRRSTEGIE